MSGGRASPVAGRAPHGSPDGRLAPAPDPAVLASRLTGRDRELCRLVWEHRVLTSVQCAELVFVSPVTARHRLVILTNLWVLDRFRPPSPRPGTTCSAPPAPQCWPPNREPRWPSS